MKLSANKPGTWEILSQWEAVTHVNRGTLERWRVCSLDQAVTLSAVCVENSNTRICFTQRQIYSSLQKLMIHAEAVSITSTDVPAHLFLHICSDGTKSKVTVCCKVPTEDSANFAYMLFNFYHLI